MVVFGAFGLIGFPLYYVIWEYLFPQPYESITLRLLGMCVALPAILIKRWPRSARRYIPLYWYLGSIIYAPFFFTFMLLQNHVNTVWSGSLVIAILLVVMLYDFVNAAVMLVIGMTAAFCAYSLTTPSPIPWDRFVEQLPVYVFTLVTAGVFNLQIAREKRAKIAAAMALGGHIAHELRTPLAAIRAGADFMDSHLQRILTHDRYLHEERPGSDMNSDDRQLILETPGIIARDVDHAFLVIDLALANTGIRPYGPHELGLIRIMPAVTSAVMRYPFKNPDQRKWIQIDANPCFAVRVIPVLLDHLVFNLLKNAVYAIQAAGRSETGEIRIWAETGGRFNRLHVRDNGDGIPTAILSRIFDPFFSARLNGTGLGLHFCRTVMNRFDGDIACRSEPGKFAELILEFPAIAGASTTRIGG